MSCCSNSTLKKKDVHDNIKRNEKKVHILLLKDKISLRQSSYFGTTKSSYCDEKCDPQENRNF